MLLSQVAIVGRPNVGKSALFNRLVRSRKALVHDTPEGHVTRDWQEATAQLGDLRFTAVDTSGLEPFLPSGSIQARATALTTNVLRRADVALLLIDGKTGVLPPDAALAKWLRVSADAAPKVVLAANKCERRGKESEMDTGAALAEAAALGFGEPVAISAETGDGMSDLYAALQVRLDPILAARQAAVEEIGGEATSEDLLDSGQISAGKSGAKAIGPHALTTSKGGGGGKDGPVKVAIMGLTNVGKSTLINWLLQEERCLTGPEPGLTRDAITTKLTFSGRHVELVDTAGWVRKARLSAHDDSDGAVAAATLEEALTVLRFVHVVVLVIDACRALELDTGLTHAEAALAARVVAEGRVLLVVANKMDALSPVGAHDALDLVQSAVAAAAPEARGMEVIGASALTGRGAGALMPTVLRAYDTWNRRVPTAQLNRWLKETCAGLAPGGGNELRRVKYLSQIKTRPPTFVAFASGASPFNDASARFLGNQIKKEFGLRGVPVRVTVRYKQRGKRKR